MSVLWIWLAIYIVIGIGYGRWAYDKQVGPHTVCADGEDVFFGAIAILGWPLITFYHLLLFILTVGRK